MNVIMIIAEYIMVICEIYDRGEMMCRDIEYRLEMNVREKTDRKTRGGRWYN